MEDDTKIASRGGGSDFGAFEDDYGVENLLTLLGSANKKEFSFKRV